MNVQNYYIENDNLQADKKVYKTQERQYSPSFRAVGMSSLLGACGGTMQWIEDKGFLASFLIQDVLGMTIPRVGAGFLRDKEVTGKYNKQEGFEVLGREGLTGPCMMAVAPITFAIAAKFGKSTSVNTKLIKRFGNSLKDIVTKPGFDKQILTNKEKFKEVFYKTNIEEILKNTLGKGNFSEDSVKFIMEQIAKYEKIPADAKLKGLFGKKNYRNERLEEIVNYINELKYTSSNELGVLNKVRVGSKTLDNIDTFSTKEAVEAMIKYCDDSIILNKNLSKLDELAAEDLKNKSITKRLIANITTIAATLGILSVIPKIYARSSVAPGAKTAMQLKENKEKENTAEKNNNAISFKAVGKGGNESLLSKISRIISNFYKESWANHFEYNGHNFSNSLMAGLSIFGLLTPRGYRAYNRAQVDENGKKDLTEIWEILIRDVTSSLAVVFAVPMLTRVAVSSYENKSGFVLMHKDRSKNKLQKTLDLLNPYSSSHVLTNSEISALYSVDSKAKMLNFCDYINENNGDIEKILSKSENKGLLEEKGLNLKEIKKLDKNEKNRQIKEFFKNLGNDSDDLIKKVMKGSDKYKNNKILSFARGLNSLPGIVATFLISPLILGWVIPKITYANTRRIHAKKEQERENTKINTSV